MATADKPARDIAGGNGRRSIATFASSHHCEEDHYGNYFLITDILASNFQPLLSQRTTPDRRTLVTEPHVGSSKDQIARAVLDTKRDTNPTNAVVIDAVETFRRPIDHREMHDVYIVISEGWGGAHVVRTVYAADEDDARQTHQDNYADEPLVAVHQ